MPALAVILLAVALLAAVAWLALMRAGARERRAQEPGARGVAGGLAAGAALLAALGAVVAVAFAAGGEQRAQGRDGEIALSAAEQRGAELFRDRCARCHALAAAGASGEVGPDLDLVRPSVRRTLRTVEHGRVGYTATMPAGLLERGDARLVAAYLVKVAGR